MIKITNMDDGTIDYVCDCGTTGECIFKPRSGSVMMVLDIICPMCSDKKRIKLLQYETEEDKERLESEDVDYYWPIILDNNVT